MMLDLWFYCGPNHNPNSTLSTAGHVSSSGCSVNGPSINNDNKSIFKAQNVSLETILSTYTYTHTCNSTCRHVCAHTHIQRHPHTQAFWLYKAKYIHSLKWAANKCPGDLEWIKMHRYMCVHNYKHMACLGCVLGLVSSYSVCTLLV